MAGSLDNQAAGSENIAQQDMVRLICPRCIASGPGEVIYFTDGNTVRRFLPSTNELRTLATCGRNSPAPPRSSSDSDDVELQLNTPWGIAFDDENTLYVADSCSHAIRRINATTGEITTLVPPNTGLRYPIGLALARETGLLYVSDAGGIKRVDISTGSLTTIAGFGSTGLQDGPSTTAKFNGPRGMVLDYSGNLYVADQGNSCIRRITPQGIVNTVLPGGAVTQPVDLVRPVFPSLQPV